MFSLAPPQLCDQASSLSVHSPKNLEKGLAGRPSGAALADDWASSAEESPQRIQGIILENVIRRVSLTNIVRAGRETSIDATHVEIVIPIGQDEATSAQ